MEVEDTTVFDLLSRENYENPEKCLSLIRKGIEVSKNEIEILKLVKIAFDLPLNAFQIDKLKILFKCVCPAASNIFKDNVKRLENTKSVQEISLTNTQLLKTNHEILCGFHKIFEQLNKSQKVTLSQVESLLLNSAEIIYSCFYHCKESEKVYEDNFTLLAEVLSDLFKKCCDLLEFFLNLLTEKLENEFDDDKEVVIFCGVLSHISKSGIVLINLEIKTMAKVWKSYMFLVEKYFSFIKDEYNIGETIASLCGNITSSVETSLYRQQENQEVNKVIKLACFILKLIIKLCERFFGYLSDCYDSLLSLLLLLCKCKLTSIEESKHSVVVDNNLLNQLIIGTDPLLSQLISVEGFAKHFQIFSKNLQHSKNKSAEYLLLCCIILKKLLSSSADIRRLWMKDGGNILEWLFVACSCSQYAFFTIGGFPSPLVSGKSKRQTDLYEHVLVASSAFLMTLTSDEFLIAENVLIKNVLQTDPWCALLAIDIWCLLVRFADPNICFVQICSLSKILKQFPSEGCRVEKWYLSSLIRRLFPLLTQSQKDKFLKFVEPSFYAVLWEGCDLNKDVKEINSRIVESVMNTTIKPVEQIIKEEEMCQFNLENSVIKGSFPQNLEEKVVKLWKFNCDVISRCSEAVKFLKIACSMAVNGLPHLSPKSLLLVLTQIKHLLIVGQPSCVKLYFTCLLRSLSTLNLPNDNFQQTILGTMADIFRELLMAKDPLVKQKAYEVFYAFSHMTRHVEVITLTVQNCSVLKVDITNYFQKKLSNPQCFDLNGLLFKLCEAKYKHVCLSKPRTGFRQGVDDIEGVILKKPRIDTGVLEETVERWKGEVKKIMEGVEWLSESQKKEIKNVCNELLNAVQ